VKTWKIILAALVIFGAGLVTGSLMVWKRPLKPGQSAAKSGTNSWQIPWGMQRPEFLQRVARELELKPEQAGKVESIIRKSNQRTEPLWDMLRPALQEELTRVRTEIRAELTPEQQKKFDEILARPPRRPPEHFHRKPPEMGPAGQSNRPPEWWRPPPGGRSPEGGKPPEFNRGNPPRPVPPVNPAERPEHPPSPPPP